MTQQDTALAASQQNTDLFVPLRCLQCVFISTEGLQSGHEPGTQNVIEAIPMEVCHGEGSS
jgi:hypothetical protein